MKIKYVDVRPIYLPALKFYPSGVALPHGDNELEVSDGEAAHLLKMKNGNVNSFIRVREKRVVEEE